MSVAYAYSEDLICAADLLPSNEGRASRVHTLIESFGVLPHVKILPPAKLTPHELTKYHDRKYISHLFQCELENEQSDDTDNETEFGLIYDCPVFDGLSRYISLIGGASVACANTLICGTAQVAINWTGGRHHAKRAKAAGFCYINDVALAILRLRSKFNKVLYIDLDLHHGDGVEAAFAMTSSVACVSVHRYQTGFYPGSGNPNYKGKGPGEGYTLNIPGKANLTDDEMIAIFDQQIEPFAREYNPQAVVLVVGADGLAKDEHREWQLSKKSLDEITQRVVQWSHPTMVLGGGGYNHTETAKCWAYITAGIAGIKTRADWVDIPSDTKYYAEYSKDAFLF